MNASGAMSGIEGLVVIGPVEPNVFRPEDEPSTKPYAATLSFHSVQTDKEMASVKSGLDGVFRVTLLPGAYRIVPLSPNPGVPPYAEPLLVLVSANTYVSVTIKYDSGIR